MNPPGSFRWSASTHASLASRSGLVRKVIPLKSPRSQDLLHLIVLLARSLNARSPKEPRRLIKLGLRLFVCMRFQDLLHSPSGVLFAFPSRYWFTIGRSRVFSLGGWSPHLRTGLHVSRPTCRTLSSTSDLSRTGLSPTAAALSRAFR